MIPDQSSRVRPLERRDPSSLGDYRLLGRLGQGGMGEVYLAQQAGGRPVAIKVLRVDLADDPELCGRFRTEVERTRQVPPFCTAEVIDADLDHDPPYLVVEYIDGPSLRDVVRENGPLTPANLHGLAIGVATALTAIHGAGVIHRDLKPGNVLLPPGSPKVIDFGIARAVYGAAEHTRHGQVLGTVAYMAPERFGPGGSDAITPAADIFAWGEVVAYAGTGRTPFGEGPPAVLAVRIMTQEPQLDGLDGVLREVVEEALAKEPADRPDARELLDRLLAHEPSFSWQPGSSEPGSRQPAGIPWAPASPAPGDSADLAAGWSDTTRFASVAALGLPSRESALLPVPRSVSTRRESAVSRREPGSELASATRALAPQPVGPVDAVVTDTWAADPRPADAWAADVGSAPGRWRFVAVSALVFSAFAAAGVVARSSGAVRWPGEDRSIPVVDAAPDRAASVSAWSVPVTARPMIRDSLHAEGYWLARDDRSHQAMCAFAGELVVTKQTPGAFRCPGPDRVMRDFWLSVDVTLRSPDTCASIWFRLSDGGYALWVCQDRYELKTHGKPTPSTVTSLKTFDFERRVPLDTPVRVGIAAENNQLGFYRDGQLIGTVVDDTFVSGRPALGIFQKNNGAVPPYTVAFANVEIEAADSQS
jgi:serine/threonine protein kinase